jgi:hypothetical protein
MLSKNAAPPFVASMIHRSEMEEQRFLKAFLASQHLCLFAKMLSKNAAPPFVASMIEATVAATVMT